MGATIQKPQMVKYANRFKQFLSPILTVFTKNITHFNKKLCNIPIITWIFETMPWHFFTSCFKAVFSHQKAFILVLAYKKVTKSIYTEYKPWGNFPGWYTDGCNILSERNRFWQMQQSNVTIKVPHPVISWMHKDFVNLQDFLSIFLISAGWRGQQQ